MLVFVPLLAFVGISILLGNLSPQNGWCKVFLRAAVIWGSYMILSTELLSLFEWITPLGLTLVWAIPCLASGMWILSQRRKGEQIILPRWQGSDAVSDRLYLLGILAILLVTALIAWLTPPQTSDSLWYHLPRVAHWAQDRAVRHFATGIERQNSMSMGAEMAVLQFYVLTGGDRVANFVEWFAMLGSLVGVSLVVRQLGAGKLGQLVAVVFAVTLPMGIVQASSTMTDYVVAFWMICVASESVHLLKEGVDSSSLASVSLAAGLAIVTKPTAFAFLLPFTILIFVILLRRVPISRTLIWGLIGVVLVIGLNLGSMIRNYQTNSVLIGQAGDITGYANQSFEPRVILSSLLRNASLHAGSPWPKLNKWIYTSILKVHVKLGLDPNSPEITSVGYFGVGKPTTNEDLTSNPVHALLILLLFSLLLLRRRIIDTPTWIYALVVAATFLSFSIVFKWQIFASRLHLPFFVLSAPIVGLSISYLFPAVVIRLIALLLFVTSWPWLTSIQSRPLIPSENSLVRSVLVEPRMDLYFANAGSIREPFTEMVDMIHENACTDVGLMLSGANVEYPLWVLLGAPDPDLYIEWIVSDTPSEIYRSPDFEPCAVICGACPEHWTETRGLPIAYQDHGFRLFMERD